MESFLLFEVAIGALISVSIIAYAGFLYLKNYKPSCCGGGGGCGCGKNGPCTCKNGGIL